MVCPGVLRHRRTNAEALAEWNEVLLGREAAGEMEWMTLRSRPLAFFNPMFETVMTTDASDHGLVLQYYCRSPQK